MEYRTIDLAGWTETGAGGNGKTYSNPQFPDKLLKINNGKLGSLAFVEGEFNLNKSVCELGLQVPAIYEIVRVGDTYGTVFQKISGKKSFSRMCADEPERIPEIAATFVSEAKALHATPCNTEKFPSRKMQAMRGAKAFPMLSRKQRAKLIAFIDTLSEPATCVHGDFQYGNIISAKGENWWIDLGRFAYGDPMFDIGHLSMITYQSGNRFVQKITHLTEAQAHQFWDCFAAGYTGSTDPAVLKEFNFNAERFIALDILVRYDIQPSKLLALFQVSLVKKVIDECLKDF